MWHIRKTLSDTIVVTIFNGFGLLLGFLFQIILAGLFGAGTALDAYLAGATLPQFLTNIISELCLYVLVPVFVIHNHDNNGENRGWRFVSHIVNLLLIALVSVAIIGLLASGLIVPIVVPGLETESQALAIKVSRWMFSAIIFSGTGSVLRSLLIAEQRFGRAYAAPVISYAIMISVTLLWHSALGVEAVAVGFLLGSIFQLLILLPGFVSNYRPDFRIPVSAIRTVYEPMLPLLIAIPFRRANTLVERYFASLLPVGAISYLGYAFKINSFVVLLLSQGLSMALLPLMARDHRERIRNHSAHSKVGRRVTVGTVAMLYFAVPLMMVIVVARVPLLSILFERGAMTHADVVRISNVLMGYSGAMLVMSVGSISANALYSMQDTASIAKVAIVGALLHIVLVSLVTGPFGEIGIAAAYSVNALFNFCWILWLLKSRVPDIDFRRMGTAVLHTLVAATVGAIIIRFMFLFGETEGLQTFVWIIVGLVGYGVMLLCLIPEKRIILQIPHQFTK